MDNIKEMPTAQQSAVSEPPVERPSGCETNDWQQASLTSLIEHIVGYYHASLRLQLPRLTELAQEAAAKGNNKRKIAELLELWQTFRQDLEMHLHKEEMVLFPAIVRMETGQGGCAGMFGCGGGIERPVAVMLREHDDARLALKDMRFITDDFTTALGSESACRELLESLSRLEVEMDQHIHKENKILFPRALALAARETSQPCESACSGCC